MSDRVPMSQSGYEKIKAQLDDLKDVQLPEVNRRLAEARAEGDLKENAEYHDCREKQGHLQARINELEYKLSRAFIVDPANITTDKVVFGTKVKVYNETFEEEEEYSLVGPGQEDYDENKILTSSPIGQALIGKAVGETAEAAIPSGTMRMKVLDIDLAE